MAEGSKPCSGSQQQGSLAPAGWMWGYKNKLRGPTQAGVNSCDDKRSHTVKVPQFQMLAPWPGELLCVTPALCPGGTPISTRGRARFLNSGGSERIMYIQRA